MSVLVTGGTGFVGSWITRELIDENNKPVILARRPDFSFLEDLKGKFEFVQGDILDLATVVETLKKFRVERVIHAGALTSPPDPLTGVKVNLEGTINIFEAARILEIRRVVYISSKAVYGAITGEYAHPIYIPISEDYRKEPDSVYGATKLASEFMASHYQKKWGLDVVSLRFAFIYGPGKSQKYAGTSIHGQIIENAARGLETRIRQGKDQKTDLVYIKDVARAIIMACFKSELKDKVCNIGSGEGTTLVDLAREVRNFFPNATIEVGPGIDYLMDNRSHYCVLDVSRAKEVLGYTPKFPLTQGVEDYVRTLKSSTKTGI